MSDRKPLAPDERQAIIEDRWPELNKDEMFEVFETMSDDELLGEEEN